jgi:hypothetical protein|nr:MAG TPA: mauD utilization (mau) D family protein [Caudoviricetes sp.]
MLLFQKKQNKNTKVEADITVAEPTKIESTEPVVKSTEEKSEEPIVEEAKTKTTKKEKKTICRVIVATPSYFVIDKNGEIITIEENNNYHKGEEILY